MSFICLSFAMRVIPMGMAYAKWTGSGTAGGALIGMIFFVESQELRRILCIGLVLSAAGGLKFIS